MKENEFITETYVTFHQAKVLEELGFDGYKWDCDFWYYYNYHDHDKPIFARCEQVDSYDVEKYWYAPTLAHAQKWLREVKGVNVYVIPQFSTGHYEYWVQFKFRGYGGDEDYGIKDTYEKALIAGINEAIKILKNKIG